MFFKKYTNLYELLTWLKNELISNINIQSKAQGNSLLEAINTHYLDYTSKVYDTFYMFYGRDNIFKTITGEYIMRDHENDKWVFVSKYDEPMFSLYSIKGLPLGKQNWIVVETEERVLLNLNNCADSDFACDNGLCINRYNRYSSPINHSSNQLKLSWLIYYA